MLDASHGPAFSYHSHEQVLLIVSPVFDLAPCKEPLFFVFQSRSRPRDGSRASVDYASRRGRRRYCLRQAGGGGIVPLRSVPVICSAISAHTAASGCRVCSLTATNRPAGRLVVRLAWRMSGSAHHVSRPSDGARSRNLCCCARGTRARSAT